MTIRKVIHDKNIKTVDFPICGRLGTSIISFFEERIQDSCEYFVRSRCDTICGMLHGHAFFWRRRRRRCECRGMEEDEEDDIETSDQQQVTKKLYKEETL
jgi:hypothetical protein